LNEEKFHFHEEKERIKEKFDEFKNVTKLDVGLTEKLVPNFETFQKKGESLDNYAERICEYAFRGPRSYKSLTMISLTTPANQLQSRVVFGLSRKVDSFPDDLRDIQRKFANFQLQ